MVEFTRGVQETYGSALLNTITVNLNIRIDKGPFILIYYEACMSKQKARSRELYLKSGMGKRYLKNRLGAPYL